jgi:hypothetical protein
MKTLLSKLLGLTSSVVAFYLPILKELISSSVEDLLPLALEIVSSLADSKRTGTQKRDFAVKRLTKAASDAGISVSESLIRFTVESAVQKLKTQEQ